MKDRADVLQQGRPDRPGNRDNSHPGQRLKGDRKQDRPPPHAVARHCQHGIPPNPIRFPVQPLSPYTLSVKLPLPTKRKPRRRQLGFGMIIRGAGSGSIWREARIDLRRHAFEALTPANRN